MIVLLRRGLNRFHRGVTSCRNWAGCEVLAGV